MKTSNVGRFILLKYCIITAIIFLLFPVIVGLFYKILTSEPVSISVFFQNINIDIRNSFIQVIITILFIFIGIYLIGGWLEILIIEKGKSESIVGMLGLFLLWVLLFVCSLLISAIENYWTFGILGLKSSITNSLVYGLFLYILLGLINGLIFGYLIGHEIKKKKSAIQ